MWTHFEANFVCLFRQRSQAAEQFTEKDLLKLMVENKNIANFELVNVTSHENL